MTEDRITSLQAEYERALDLCKNAEVLHSLAATRAKEAHTALEDAIWDSYRGHPVHPVPSN